MNNTELHEALSAPGICPKLRVQGASATMASPKECREWLEANIGLLQRVIANACRKGRVSAADADDFASVTFLRLIEHEYAVLRRFEGRSALSTYLQRVVARYLLDWRNARWGKWRPSKQATRAGALAVQVEQLTSRDGLSLTEAMEVVANGTPGTEPSVALGALRSITSSGRLRTTHRGRVREVTCTNVQVATTDRADACVERREALAQAHRVSDALREILTPLSADDRLLLRMRFHDEVAIHDIACRLGIKPKVLYRRFSILLARLKKELERLNLGVSDIRAFIGHPEVTIPPGMMSAKVVASGSHTSRLGRARSCPVDITLGIADVGSLLGVKESVITITATHGCSELTASSQTIEHRSLSA